MSSTTANPSPGTHEADAIVVGAGIAGLTAAFRLQRAGLRVGVVEAAETVGGAIASARVNGHLFERGPTTVLSTAPHLAALIDDADLRGEAVESRPMAGRRLVWRHGRLHALPEKPPQLLRCTALSPLGRLRLLMEPLVPGRDRHDDETLGQFFRRRLGREATAGLADPFVTGVFAGRLDHLGVDAFSRLAELEREHGSLLKGMVRARKAQKARAEEAGETLRSGPAPLISFADGLGHLPAALVEYLGRDGASRVLTDHRAIAIERDGDAWLVRMEDRDAPLRAPRLVIATPAAAAAELLGSVLGEDLDFLRNLDHPHVATVGLGFRCRDVDHPLEAFGLLIASDSRLEHDVLGVLFVSSIFPNRCPEGEVTLTVMVGGSRDPGTAELDDGALVERARGALGTLVGARGEPTAVCVSRWPRAIPQYPPGHANRVAALRRRLGLEPGLAVAGNWLDGVGLEGAVASGDRAAKALSTNIRAS
jgi:oxygen-dependent protoporphyrinogen oxidase